MQDSGAACFPAQLQDWAGNRSGGVRRLFDEKSGRPGGVVFQTNLLYKLEDWARGLANGKAATPRILLLVGGPGNGKTEAIESTVRWLDAELGQGGALLEDLKRSFFPPPGVAVPRMVRVEAPRPDGNGSLALAIVQDASAVVEQGGKDAAELLLDELEQASLLGGNSAYLCCVNRGVLDDALISAIDGEREGPRRLLEAVTRAVSLAPDAPPCWPLTGFPDVAVWPMDAETLLQVPAGGDQAPAQSLLLAAIDGARWPRPNSCDAGAMCPFCTSRERLAKDREQSALLGMLRLYEVGSGKRWSFRDLFSLVSYTLSGHRMEAHEAATDPCKWAAALWHLHERARQGATVRKPQAIAIFELVAAQYQHALFHKWEYPGGLALLREIRELQLTDDNTAMGLHWFLASRRAPYLPTMISGSLEGFCALLDPAIADPDEVVPFSNNTALPLRELDVRFSRSVAEGLAFVRKYQALTKLDIELLERLGKLDSDLSLAGVRRRRPAAATTLQRFVRDFACRLVRRALCARVGVVREGQFLSEFQRILDNGSGQDLDEVAQEVERLLNDDRDFAISLTTTFGQPLPPETRQAMLVVPARTVRPFEGQVEGRPSQPIRYMCVGEGRSAQHIALTYELFRAVKELELGMSIASLPRSVVALLDTTKARLAGPIVRDQGALERAQLRIGAGGTTVMVRRSVFSLGKEGRSR